MEKQDINLIKQIQEEKIIWNQEALDRALSLKKDGLVEYVNTIHSGQWVVTEKGLNEIPNQYRSYQKLSL